MKFISSLLLLLTPVALALPTSVVTEVEAPVEAEIDTRACYVTCGSVCYTSAQVSAARTKGYSYYQSGSEAGSSTYPHTYNNYEGFTFLVSGPYQEFPLKTSGAYTGGKLTWCQEIWTVLIVKSRISWCRPCHLQHQGTACWRNYAHWRIRQQLRCLLRMVECRFGMR